MADISAWSPVDESNTSAPPAGWPENMPPSGVNNSARAMMGAIRRWYDTVTGTLDGIVAALAGYLPLGGGTVTGILAVNSNFYVAGTSYLTGVNASGNITGAAALEAPLIGANAYTIRGATFLSAPADLSVVQIGDGTTTANISLYGYGLHINYYDNDYHYLRNSGGGTNYAIFSAGGSFNQNGTWGVISDGAWKEDVQAYGRGLAAIQALRPCSFRYSGGPFKGERRQYGLIAQEAETVVPEMVAEVEFDGEPVLTTQPGMLIWLLVNSCRELAARVEALETRGET